MTFALFLQGKNADLIRGATFAMAGTQLAPTSAPADQEIATFAGATPTDLTLHQSSIDRVVVSKHSNMISIRICMLVNISTELRSKHVA